MSLPNERIHGMDAVRAVAMVLGVVLHAVIVYQVSPRPGWLQDASYQSSVYDVLYDWIHAFRMPLFYMVAGFFALMVLRKVGTARFVQKRFVRIVIPFVVSTLLLAPPSSVPFKVGTWYDGTLDVSRYLDYFDLSLFLQWHGFYHLWFLYYLIIFYLLTVLVLQVPFFNKAFDRRLPLNAINATFFAVLWGILFFFYEGKVEAWTGLRVVPGQVLYYGAFFWLGCVFYQNQSALRWMRKHALLLLGAGTICFLVVGWLLPPLDWTLASGLSVLQTQLMVFGFMGACLRFFDRQNAAIRYISDASYWYYLLHFPLIVNLQVLLADVQGMGALKPLVVFTVTTLVSLVTYHWLVRYSVVGVILHGPRTKSKGVLSAA